MNVAAGQDHAFGDLAPNGSGFEVCDEKHLRANERIGFVERFDPRTNLPTFFGTVIQLDSEQFVGGGVRVAGLRTSPQRRQIERLQR